MKLGDWMIALAFIFMGLGCFVMSISFVDHSESVHAALMSAVNYCLWIGPPLTIIGIIYLWVRSRRSKK